MPDLQGLLQKVYDEETSTLRIDRASLTTPAHGALAGTITATQMPDVACSVIRFKARASNTGKVYVGGAGVTVTDGTTDTTSGLELSPGDDTGWMPVDNANRFYRICTSDTDCLTYLALD